MRACLHPLIAAVLVLTVAWPAAAQESAPPVQTASADGESPSRETEGTATDASRAERTGETSRPKPDALIRALVLLSSAGGSRPFPLMPR